jgi:hypothetical protein
MALLMNSCYVKLMSTVRKSIHNINENEVLIYLDFTFIYKKADYGFKAKCTG